MTHDIYNTLEQATIEVLKRYNREHLLEGTRSLSAMFYKVTNSLLSFYKQDELEEVLMDAWTHIFLINGEKTIRMFTGRHPKTGDTVHITSYLTMLMHNAIITYSQKNNPRFNNEESVNPIEQEGQEDAYMRAISTPTKTRSQRLDTEYIGYLEGLIQEARIILNSLYERNASTRKIKKAEKQIAKLTKELKEASGDVSFKPNDNWDEVYEQDDTSEDNLSFDSLLKRVSSQLTSYEEAVLAAMLGGMSNKEIQAVLDDIDVNETIKTIQNKVLDMAEADEFELNDTTMIDVISQLKPAKETRRRTPISISDVNRSFRKCVDEFCSKKTQDFISREVFLGVKDINQVLTA